MGTNDTYNSASTTQEQRIIALLHASWPAWVPAPSLARISLQYSARIFSLRRKGWQIENRVEIVSGKRHGCFRLARPGTYPNPTNKKAATGTKPKAVSPKNQQHSTSEPIGSEVGNATLFPPTERHLDLG